MIEIGIRQKDDTRDIAVFKKNMEPALKIYKRKKGRGRIKQKQRASSPLDYVSTKAVRRSISSPVNGNVVTTVLGRISRSND